MAQYHRIRLVPTRKYGRGDSVTGLLFGRGIARDEDNQGRVGRPPPGCPILGPLLASCAGVRSSLLEYQLGVGSTDADFLNLVAKVPEAGGPEPVSQPLVGNRSIRATLRSYPAAQSNARRR